MCFLDESRDSIQIPPKNDFRNFPIFDWKFQKHPAGTEWSKGLKAFLPTGRIGCAESSDGLKWRRCKGPLEVDPEDRYTWMHPKCFLDNKQLGTFFFLEPEVLIDVGSVRK